MLRPRTWLPLIVLTGVLLARVSTASEFQEKRFNVTPFVGWTLFDRELKAPVGAYNNDLYLGGRLGMRLVSPLWLDLAGGYTKTDACDCDPTWTHLSANLLLVSSKPRAVNPFVSLGAGVSKMVPQVGDDKTNTTLEAAAGVKVKVTNTVGIRLEARNALLLQKSSYSKSHLDNVVLGAGLVFAFGGKDEDSDGDGVRDGLDKCPDTPRGCQVDANGCPIDSDGDGVCDGIDMCPNTLKGCAVDARGCPIDSDGDGVCDGLDKCPGTPAGTKVDADGCAVVVERVIERFDPGTIQLTNVHFDFDKSTIRADGYAVLDSVGNVLTQWPGLNIEIDGHADSRGTDAYNLALSQRRAESVSAYLREHFPNFGAAQVTTKGYGESRPVAPNNSPANMQLNRRGEFVVLTKETLQREK